MKNKNVISSTPPRTKFHRTQFNRIISLMLSFLMAFSCFSVGIFPIASNAAVGMYENVETPYNDGLSPYIVYCNGYFANFPTGGEDDKESDNFVLYSAIDKSKDKGTYDYYNRNDQYYCFKIHNHTGRTAKIIHIGNDSPVVFKQTEWLTNPLYLEDHNHVVSSGVEDKEWYVDIKAKSLSIGIYDLTVRYNLEGVFNPDGTLVEFEQPFYIYVFDSSTLKTSTDEFKVQNKGIRLRVSFSAKYGVFNTQDPKHPGNFISDGQIDNGDYSSVVGNTPFEYNYYVDPSVVAKSDISDGENIQWQDLGLQMDFYSLITNNNFMFQPYDQYAKYGRGGMVRLIGDFSNKTATVGGATFGIGNVDDKSSASILTPSNYNNYWNDPCIASAKTGRQQKYEITNYPKHTSTPGEFEMRKIWGGEWHSYPGRDSGNTLTTLNSYTNHYFPFFGYIFKPLNTNSPATIQFGGFSDNSDSQYAPNTIDKGMVFETREGEGACAYNMQGKINVYVCDKSKLRELLSAPNFSPLSKRYNNTTWENYRNARKAAVEALGNPYSKQGDVNTAATNLENAMKALGYTKDNSNTADLTHVTTQFAQVVHRIHDGECLKDSFPEESSFSISTNFNGERVKSDDTHYPNYILIDLHADSVNIGDFAYLNDKSHEGDTLYTLCEGKNKRTALSTADITDHNPATVAKVYCDYWMIDFEEYEPKISEDIKKIREMLSDYWEYSDEHLEELLHTDTGIVAQMLKMINGIVDKNGNPYSDKPETSDEIQQVINSFNEYMVHPAESAKFVNGFVADFGLPSTYDVLDRGDKDYEKTVKTATSFDNFKIVGMFQSDNYDLTEDANKHPKTSDIESFLKDKNITLETNTLETHDSCATLTLNPDADNDAITYKPLEKVATDIETVYIVVETTRKGLEELGEDVNQPVTTYTVSPIQIIPASVVYYEEDFQAIKYFPGKTDGGQPTTEWTDEGSRPDSGNVQNWEQNDTYGYDKSYNKSATYSMGKAKKVTVSAANNPNSVYSGGKEGNDWPCATFTFKGTGYDLITYMSKTTGTVEVALYEGTYDGEDPKKLSSDNLVSNRLIDTFTAYEYNDGNWSVTSGDNALYQIPVVSETNLTYGTYTVKITPKYSTIFDHTNKGSYDFYIDGFRVYDPTGVATGKNSNGNEVIKAKYASDGELIVDERSVRSMITKDGFNETGVFIQGMSNATYDDYVKYGPKNELYLTAGQSIAFTPKLTNLPEAFGSSNATVNIELSLHTVGTSPTASVQFSNTSETTSSEIQYRNATPLYFKIPATVVQGYAGGNDSTGKFWYSFEPITVTCKSGTVSLCNIKVTANTDLNAPAAANIVSPVSRIAMFRAMPMANTANNNKVQVSYGLTADELESVKAITERVAALSPDDGGHFVPDVFEVPETVTTDSDKAQIAVKTSSEVARVTVDGADASLAGEKDGVKEWIYVYTGDIGEHKLTVVAYNQSSYTSDAAEVKVIFNAPAVQPEPEKPSEPSTAPSDNDAENVTEQKSVFDKLIDFILSIFNLLKVLFNG